jgi:hypothetical protein
MQLRNQPPLLVLVLDIECLNRLLNGALGVRGLGVISPLSPREAPIKRNVNVAVACLCVLYAVHHERHSSFITSD